MQSYFVYNPIKQISGGLKSVCLSWNVMLVQFTNFNSTLCNESYRCYEEWKPIFIRPQILVHNFVVYISEFNQWNVLPISFKVKIISNSIYLSCHFYGRKNVFIEADLVLRIQYNSQSIHFKPYPCKNDLRVWIGRQMQQNNVS